MVSSAKTKEMKMDFFESLIERNAEFAHTGINPKLKMIPSRQTMIIGCVDPRVDPMELFKLAGEVAIIRNVGGRVMPSRFETIGILRVVSRVAGQEVGAGWDPLCFNTQTAASPIAITTPRSC
ncbi:hypothetical protein [Hyphomicrobium sp.]|jgi:carbonic anhydrase|uniref:hypothetical protein n=1 Tax=Hyphomicrobium sp. TaxID=82 RepID=UPI00356AF584